MYKSTLFFLAAVLIVSILVVPGQTVYAQISFPAEMNKSFSPISILAGSTSRLSVTIFNPNGFPLTNAAWTDNLIRVQPGLVIANPVGVTNTCGGSVSASAGATTFSLSGGTVPAQIGANPGSCTVSINVTSTTTGSLINTIPAGELSSTGGGVSITNTTPASATLSVTGTPTPTIAKGFSPGTIWAGQISQLSIVITNNALSRTLTQVRLTDNLPANVFLATPPNASTSGCGSPTLTAAAGGASVAMTNGTIAPSSSCIITVDVTSNTQGRFTNTIPANALRTQEGLTNATSASAQLTVREIGLSKRFSPQSLAPGGTTTLIITLQNPKSTPYTGASFTDTLPPPLTAVSVTENTCGGTVSITPPTSISLSGGTIPAGSPTSPGTCTISVVVTVPPGTDPVTLQNTIPTGGLTTDQGAENQSPANATVIIGGTDMTGIKSFSASTIAPGGNSRLRVDFFAPIDTDLTNFAFTDNLPAGVTVSNSTAPSISGCGASAVLSAPTGATSISLTNGLILAVQRCRVEVYVTSSTSGVHINTIPPGNISNTQGRLPTDALTASLTVTGGGTLAMELVKGFDPLTVFGGSASTMSIELINPGTATLTGIAFIDIMPDGMILANPLNFNVGTCGGTLTGVPGANSFSFSGGTLPARTRCILTLSATMTVNGNLTNRIPAGAVTTTNGISNPDPVEATLTNLPGASLSKYFSPNPIAPGAQSLLTITIQNTGGIALTGMGFSDSLPAGLVIAPSPAPVNNCGGSLTAVAGTQLVQLTGGSLAGSSACTIVVPVTGSTVGEYQNTIPAGALITDPSVNITNTLPAIDALVITGNPPGDGDGDGGGGPGGGNNATSAFLIPVTGFAPARVTRLDDFSRPAYATTSLEIEIPVIRVKTSIVGVESKNGRWDVSWLQDQVGWLNGTAYPTWNGNSLLTAHAVNANGKPGVFSKLKSLGVGEYIFIYSAGYRYTYQVVSNAYVLPNDRTVMNHEAKPYLTLLTCDTYDEKTGTYLRRVAVRAKLVDVRATR